MSVFISAYILVCVCVPVCFLFMLVVNGSTSCEYYSLWTVLLRTLLCATANREILLIDKFSKTKLKSLKIYMHIYKFSVLITLAI